MYNPRSEESEKAYRTFKQSGAQTDVFDFTQETVVRDFVYWAIIKNRFPYDNMARVNDILVSKRPIVSHYAGATEEQEEYHNIIRLLAEENYYDALIENFPRSKSVPKFAHAHLVQWHGAQG